MNAPALHPRLVAAARALTQLDRSLKPVQLADQREAVLIEGLHGLAAHHGREIAPTRIDANGEMDFFIQGGQGYGEGLAAILSLVPRRCGVAPYVGPADPGNSWCRIHHFDVEKLVNLIARTLLDEEPRENSV